MAPTTYTATFNGKIVGSRKSPRPYAPDISHFIEAAVDLIAILAFVGVIGVWAAVLSGSA